MANPPSDAPDVFVPTGEDSARGPDEDDDLAAALAEVLGMSWDGDVPVDAGAEHSQLPADESPELWASDTALSEWAATNFAPDASLSPSPAETWAAEMSGSDWAPEATSDPEPLESGPAGWWDAPSPDAVSDTPEEVGEHPEPYRRPLPEAEESTAALQEAGFASPLSSALGVLGRVIPGQGAETAPPPSAPAEPGIAGGSSGRRPEWLSVAALRQAWTTHRHEWAPGLLVGALIVVAFAVVLAAGGRDDTNSRVSTRPQPSVTSPDTIYDVPTTLAPDATVATEEVPVEDGAAAVTPAAPSRSSLRGRSTPAPAAPKPKASKPAAKAPAPAPAPAPPAAAPAPPPPASDTDDVRPPPRDDRDDDVDPDPTPDPDPPTPEPPPLDVCEDLDERARTLCRAQRS